MNLSFSLARLFSNFRALAVPVHTNKWQAMDISKQPAGRMMEFLHYSMVANLEGETDLNYYRKAIAPNLPWADNHYLERICGTPINPGTEWANWPWANKAQESLNEYGQFNHNYMERMWPKKAGSLFVPTETPEQFNLHFDDEAHDFVDCPSGIRGQKFGDMNDLISLLIKEPDTRQAFLPIWFPEDTGDLNPGRKPCTIGYHFILRNGKLDMTYYIRSCDVYRHIRDDIYLAVRLLLTILEVCKQTGNPAWDNVKPGSFIMHITSLHCFVNDYKQLFGRVPE